MLSILDTDTLTLFLHAHPRIRASAAESRLRRRTIWRSRSSPSKTVLSGWNAEVKRARRDEEMVEAYRRLLQAVEFFRLVRILPFDLNTVHRYRELRRAHRRLGANDLKIAAVAMVHSATLVTANHRDFSQIGGLTIEDWSS